MVMKQAHLGEDASRNHFGAIKLEVRAAEGRNQWSIEHPQPPHVQDKGAPQHPSHAA
jgi:hypothetical protein